MEYTVKLTGRQYRALEWVFENIDPISTDTGYDGIGQDYRGAVDRILHKAKIVRSLEAINGRKWV